MTINNVLFLLLFLPLSIYAQQDASALARQGLKKYDTPQGLIEYTVSGDAEGQELLFFDLNGWRSLKKQTITFEHRGINTLQTVHEITDGNTIHRLNGGDSTYTSRADFKWSQLAASGTPDDASQEILFLMGGTYLADSTLLDKVCQVWTFDSKSLQELWIWNQLVLKRKIKLGENIIVTTATKIVLTADVDPSNFTIPPYFTKKE